MYKVRLSEHTRVRSSQNGGQKTGKFVMWVTAMSNLMYWFYGGWFGLRLFLIRLKMETGCFPRSCMVLCVVTVGRALNISDKPWAVLLYSLFRTTAKGSVSESLWFGFLL